MATESETPVTPPAASKGVMERIAAKLGIKSESEIVAGLNEEISLLTAAANEAQAEVETGKAEIARQNSVITGLKSKITGIEAVVPGITASADPAALLTKTITEKTADQVAAMGLPPGQAPGTETKQGDATENVMARADFDKLTAEAQSAYCLKGGKLKD